MNRFYNWGKIDKIIEEEMKLENFQQTPEIDDILYKYANLFKQVSLLFFFGMIYPPAFIICWLTNCIDKKMLMTRLLKFVKRPVPRGCQDIGNWEKILNYISMLSIFFTAGLAAFNLHVFEDSCARNKVFWCEPGNVRITTFYVYISVGLG